MAPSITLPCMMTLPTTRRRFQTTLEGLRKHCGDEKIIAVLEPRSNTMKMGVHKETLVNSLKLADSIFVYKAEDVEWNMSDMTCEQIPPSIQTEINTLVDEVVSDESAWRQHSGHE